MRPRGPCCPDLAILAYLKPKAPMLCEALSLKVLPDLISRYFHRICAACCCMCVLMLLYICVLMLLYLCPHTTYVSSFCYICVLILLHMCPNTATFVFSCWLTARTCPHTATCVLILLYVSSYCLARLPPDIPSTL